MKDLLLVFLSVLVGAFAGVYWFRPSTLPPAPTIEGAIGDVVVDTVLQAVEDRTGIYVEPGVVKTAVSPEGSSDVPMAIMRQTAVARTTAAAEITPTALPTLIPTSTPTQLAPPTPAPAPVVVEQAPPTPMPSLKWTVDGEGWLYYGDYNEFAPLPPYGPYSIAEQETCYQALIRGDMFNFPEEQNTICWANVINRES